MLIYPPLVYPSTDLDAGRLDFAKKLGATSTIQVKTRDTRLLAKQVEETLGCKPDQTIECSGAQSSISAAIYVSITTAI